jgi:hypothetical protein
VACAVQCVLLFGHIKKCMLILQFPFWVGRYCGVQVLPPLLTETYR